MIDYNPIDLIINSTIKLILKFMKNRKKIYSETYYPKMIPNPRIGLVTRTPSQDPTRYLPHGYEHEKNNRASTPNSKKNLKYLKKKIKLLMKKV